MAVKIEFNNSAFKHHCTKADIYAAFDKLICDGLMPDHENKYLLIGFDTKGSLIEVMYNIIDEETVNVFHAMPCRNTTLKFVGR